MCFAVTVEHDYDKQNDIIVDSETDNEADKCSIQRDDDSDKEDKMTTSGSHSKVIKQFNYNDAI